MIWSPWVSRVLITVTSQVQETGKVSFWFVVSEVLGMMDCLCCQRLLVRQTSATVDKWQRRGGGGGEEGEGEGEGEGETVLDCIL